MNNVIERHRTVLERLKVCLWGQLVVSEYSDVLSKDLFASEFDMKLRHFLAMLAVSAAMTAACQGQAPIASLPQPSATSRTPSHLPLSLTADVNAKREVPIESVASASLRVEGSPDWLELAFGSVWVANEGMHAIDRIDTATNQVIAKVPINNPCGAMASGFDSICST